MSLKDGTKSAAPAAGDPAKVMTGQRVFTHPDGITRVSTITLEGIVSSGAANSLVPEGCTVFYEGPAFAVMLRAFPPHFSTGYHNDPPHQHQLVFTLGGEAAGACKDGSTFTLAPGDFAFIQDPTGTGHTAYDAGGVGFTQIFVSVPGE